MIKQKLLKQIIKTLSYELSQLQETVLKAFEYAQSDDLISEGKYDTRKVEANYLAHAQKARVEEIKNELIKLETIHFKKNASHTHVQIGSLLKLQSLKKVSRYFIVPTKGLGKIIVDNNPIFIISFNSPIAMEAMDLKVRDQFIVELPEKNIEYLIVNLK